MKKQTTTKIILRLIIFVFVAYIIQSTLPVQAANSSMSNLYTNPNQSSNNAYKFKVSDVVNSNLLTNVVGCTGVVNKVSTWMVSFLQSPVKKAAMVADKVAKVRTQLESSCGSIKSAAEAVGDSIPIIGGLSRSIDTIFSKIKVDVRDQQSFTKFGETLGVPAPKKTDEQVCLEQVKSIDPKQLELMIKDAEKQDEIQLKEQCLDGIAITLAKNQLSAMTRSMMNWVNSGYGGNPFFVQNMRNFTNNLEQNVLETGIDILLAPNNQNPYASDFARSAVASRGIVSGSENFLGNLQSDLGNFITDPRSYYTDEQLSDAERTQMALQRAREANNVFANDFATGGWNGWLALTQIDQNNPLGFTMLASQSLADQVAFETQSIKDELIQNDGFLSQKVCVKWQQYDENGKPVTTTKNGKVIYAFSGSKRESFPDKCADDGWKTITPGSLIKEKTTTYLNSPERQLELAKTINDSLNALFSALIYKLEGGGLAGLSDSATDAPMNWTDNINTSYTSSDGNSTYDNNGAYDGFNLTRDLGNTYIHDPLTNGGNWNAKNNCIILAGTTCPTDTEKWQRLYPDTAPLDYNYDATYNTNYGKPMHNNVYYTVKIEGKTKLINEGYNGWAVGDRAFWDGEKWQNWKKGQTNPIKKRGVIQIQQDYIVAAKEILGVLPNVMTNLGELDYCIPGPNPSYKTNSTDAQSAYQDWVGSIYVGAYDNTNLRFGVRIDQEGDRTYDNLYNIHMENSAVWNLIEKSMSILIYQFSNICGPDKGDSCSGGYFLDEGKDTTLSEDGAKLLQDKQDIMNKELDYVNSYLFQNFYEIFDKMMNKLYFKNMTSMYLENENSSINPLTDKNPAYIPMAEEGLDLTKNILYYNDDIEKAVQEYTDAIAQARINIAKLEPIKAKVSAIIKDAQDRRATNMIRIINEESVRTERKDENGNPYTLTEAKYKKLYASCLDEENIQFYDADTITNTGGIDTERCTNGIDDDLDRLIDIKDPDCEVGFIKCTDHKDNDKDGFTDMNDPDCAGVSSGSDGDGTDQIFNNNNTNIVPQDSINGCMIDPSTSAKYNSNLTPNKNCLERTASECEINRYNDGNVSYSCKFIPMAM